NACCVRASSIGTRPRRGPDADGRGSSGRGRRHRDRARNHARRRSARQVVGKGKDSMVRSGAAAVVDVQPIDRLEEKVRQMVGVIDSLRTDKARAAEEVSRLQQEVASLKSRLADGATASAELATMREERDLIRARVTQMISQIDKLDL